MREQLNRLDGAYITFLPLACETGLTHVDDQGRANMVDVSTKGVTVRTAR